MPVQQSPRVLSTFVRTDFFIALPKATVNLFIEPTILPGSLGVGLTYLLLKRLFEVLDFGADNESAIGFSRVVSEVILVGGFGLEKSVKRRDLRFHCSSKSVLAVQFVFKEIGDLLLHRTVVKNDRSVLRADVISLTI